MKFSNLSIMLILLFSFFSSPLLAEEPTYLYVFFHDDNTQGERFRTAFPSMESCLTALNQSKTPEQKSTGGDYEVAVVMWCAGKDFERNNNGTWWKDDIKNTPPIQQ